MFALCTSVQFFSFYQFGKEFGHKFDRERFWSFAIFSALRKTESGSERVTFCLSMCIRPCGSRHVEVYLTNSCWYSNQFKSRMHAIYATNIG